MIKRGGERKKRKGEQGRLKRKERGKGEEKRGKAEKGREKGKEGGEGAQLQLLEESGEPLPGDSELERMKAEHPSEDASLFNLGAS